MDYFCYYSGTFFTRNMKIVSIKIFHFSKTLLVDTKIVTRVSLGIIFQKQ